jgi:16S rRNA (guanine966-N2)-methyltransferase
MNTVRIISGELKGRVIPFSNRKYGNADITPQKVKGALFSALGEYLDGLTFIDLFGCSGQIGFEALSRGARPVIINESERERFGFIREYSLSLPDASGLVLLNRTAESALRYCGTSSRHADICFMDPPYVKKGNNTELYDNLVLKAHESGALKENGLIVIQHSSMCVPEETIHGFTRIDAKKYGSTSLSYYRNM